MFIFLSSSSERLQTEVHALQRDNGALRSALCAQGRRSEDERVHEAICQAVLFQLKWCLQLHLCKLADVSFEAVPSISSSLIPLKGFSKLKARRVAQAL